MPPSPQAYGYDGHGSVRQLRSSTGTVTDAYDYDAFGNLINQTGSTPNNYLFAGEQYDPATGLYYSRARYLNGTTGRFWTTDTYEGSTYEPTSLHRYLYSSANPVNRVDPSGNDDIEEMEKTSEINIVLSVAASVLFWNLVLGNGGQEVIYPPSAVAQARADAQKQVEQQERNCNCKNVLFHYTDPVSAVLIYFDDEMIATPEYPNLPAGAYASDIEPWDPSYTQETLAPVFYFSKERQQRAVGEGKLTWFVVLCNDQKPGFENTASHQFVKAGSYPGRVKVNAIFIFRNPMPVR